MSPPEEFENNYLLSDGYRSTSYSLTHKFCGGAGNSLLEALEGQEKNDIGYRSGYFDGYVNGVADFSGNVLWCPPQNVKAGQLSKIVANYLRAHPERLHKGAETLVIEALSGPFPCKR